METTQSRPIDVKLRLLNQIDRDFRGVTLNLFLGVTALMIASGIAYLFANGVRPSTFATFVWGLLGIFLFVFGLGQIIKGAMRIILRTRATTMIYASYVQAEFRPMKLPALQPTDE